MAKLKNRKVAKISYFKTHSNVLIESKINFKQAILFLVFALSYLLIAFEFGQIFEMQKTKIVKNNLTLYLAIIVMMFQIFNIKVQYIFIKWNLNQSLNLRIFLIFCYAAVGLIPINLLIANVFAYQYVSIFIYLALVLGLITFDLVFYFLKRAQFVMQFRRIIYLLIFIIFINLLIFISYIPDLNAAQDLQSSLQDFFNRNNLILVACVFITIIGNFVGNQIITIHSRHYFAKYNDSIYSLMEVVYPLSILLCIGYTWIDFSASFVFSISIILSLLFLLANIMAGIIILLRAIFRSDNETKINLVFTIMLLVGITICSYSIKEQGTTFNKNGWVYFFVVIGLIFLIFFTSFCSYMTGTVWQKSFIFSSLIALIGKLFSFILILQFLGWEYYILEHFAPVDIIITTLWLSWALIHFLYYLNKYLIVLLKEKNKWS